MTSDELRKTLEKQLQLLSERSQETKDVTGLVYLTMAMCATYDCLNARGLYRK